MSRIIIFGDSFASRWPDEYVWTNQLTKRCDAEHVNYATAGSSIEYSLYKLKDYLQNNYKKDDTIIFVATNPSRSPIIHQDYDPKWSCFHHHVPGDEEYYRILTRYTDINTDKYKYWIVASILNGLTNDALLICAFDECDEKSTRENFIVSKMKLANVSAGNYPTPNHLDKQNHSVLAEQMYESIINKNDLFDRTHYGKPRSPDTVDKHLWENWLAPQKN